MINSYVKLVNRLIKFNGIMDCLGKYQNGVDIDKTEFVRCDFGKGRGPSYGVVNKNQYKLDFPAFLWTKGKPPQRFPTQKFI